jgi:hypothetical protein
VTGVPIILQRPVRPIRTNFQHHLPQRKSLRGASLCGIPRQRPPNCRSRPGATLNPQDVPVGQFRLALHLRHRGDQRRVKDNALAASTAVKRTNAKKIAEA